MVPLATDMGGEGAGRAENSYWASPKANSRLSDTQCLWHRNGVEWDDGRSGRGKLEKPAYEGSAKFKGNKAHGGTVSLTFKSIRVHQI